MGRWQRQAFQSWKIKNDQQVEVRANRYAAEHELVSRLWRRWIGYVAFRLQNQRRQQQKVLARARNSLQRTILSTVFVSWSTSWRRDQSQEKLIVRAFRRNVGQIRARRCLQAWLQYSKLMARRRAAVRRLYHRHCIRSLGIKWRHWIRASMSATITRLEAVTIRTQEQVHKVVRSTGRASILRRIIRKWRLVSVEATRQQRRRDLFTEKRRYMALQGTMRRWQTRITSCSLSKQRRTLRLLLNRLQLSLERQAFRLWERRARAHTLFERDRVSAELFRRSEVRVLVLTEKIQTERERRIVFSAWRSIAFRKKTIWKFLHSILLKYQQRLLQMSWSWWTSHTRTQRGVAHLNVMIAQRLKAAAWRKLTQMYHHHGLRVTGARLAGAIWHKIVLRHAWGHWKRIDNIVSSHAALEEAKASSTQSMLALKEVFARRHHKKRVLTELFATWKQQTAHIKRFRHQLCVALGRLVEATPVYHFHKWRTIIERQSYLDLLLSRVVKRQRIRKMRSALGHWRRWAREMVHRQQLEQTDHALSHQREVSAKRIAVVKFLSWQRPCVEGHFVRWKVHVEQRRRYVVEQRAALSHCRIRRLRQSIWRAWRHLVCQSRRRAQIILKISNSTRVVLLAHGFNQLDRWCDWRHDVDHTAIRLVRIHELWQSRRGFSALRQHQHEAIRRQSVMAASAFSAHNTRQRERQIQRMRAVSLVLQRKTNSALYDRFFSRWVMYAKIQTHTKSMIKLARARSLKRIERSCFVKWKRHTRYSVTLRHKLYRCQQNWQRRRQKRVWNAWVNFTQHSRGVKHAVYDKLIICALRHSLQGAWGRWKAYTRHANDLMDAHRVAQWEHATAKRDKLIDTLEDKHERLLLRAAQLGQQNNALRRQLVSSAATRIDRVLELGRKIRVSIALKAWEHKLEQVRMLQSRLKALGSRYQRLALRRWQSTILHSRAAEEVKRVQLDMTEWAARIAHACSTQWLKRRAFMSWRAVGRAHREINRRLVVAQRRRDLKCIRTCWTSWKSMIDVRTRQHAAATASLVKKRLLAVLQVHWQWKSAHKRSRIAKLNAVHCLVLLRRVWQRQVTINAWNQWRNFAAEVETALLRTTPLPIQTGGSVNQNGVK